MSPKHYEYYQVRSKSPNTPILLQLNPQLNMEGHDVTLYLKPEDFKLVPLSFYIFTADPSQKGQAGHHWRPDTLHSVQAGAGQAPSAQHGRTGHPSIPQT